MSFETALEVAADVPIVVELKSSLQKDHMPRVVGLLNDRPNRAAVIVASASQRVLRDFEEAAHGRYATNVPLMTQVRALMGCAQDCELAGRLYATTHQPIARPQRLIQRMQRLGGSVYVFLTGFAEPLFPPMDREPGQVDRSKLAALLASMAS